MDLPKPSIVFDYHSTLIISQLDALHSGNPIVTKLVFSVYATIPYKIFTVLPYIPTQHSLQVSALSHISFRNLKIWNVTFETTLIQKTSLLSYFLNYPRIFLLVTEIQVLQEDHLLALAHFGKQPNNIVLANCNKKVYIQNWLKFERRYQILNTLRSHSAFNFEFRQISHTSLLVATDHTTNDDLFKIRLYLQWTTL